MDDRNARYIVTVYVGSLSDDYEALSVEASKHTTAEEIVSCIVQKLGFPNPTEFELAEVIGNSVGQDCKERRINSYESPVSLKLLWPKGSMTDGGSGSRTKSPAAQQNNLPDSYRFCLREKLTDSLWNESFVKDTQFIRDYFYRFHFQPKDKEYPDLCQLPDLNESTLLESLRSRFNAGHIYTYVGSILIAVNPFKFYPIYNPKYVKLYQNRRREELPPHIFAIADSAYHTMLKEKRDQCIVISGESGSGKTESTNLLLHHLTALSQKGTHGSGVEQTILSAGPVLEAFGNAKTAHNNNSSRFGKFIQVRYRENGMVHGSLVQKFLLEKSRICCQALHERNYHVFYYLLAGASEAEKSYLHLLSPKSYHYLNQSGCYTLEGVDESYEFSRLKQSMELVGFGADVQRKLFSVLSAVILLGNVKFLAKKSSYRDESVQVKNIEVVSLISSLLRVTEATLLASLTSKRARVSGEMLVINYRMAEAIAARDAMAKCLYGSLFDWIVLQLNHALLSKKGSVGHDIRGNSIGVLDIFGFEDFECCNSFEQYCINYANEHLQHYFNQHVFKYEQEEYKREGIRWTNIAFLDNSQCLSLIEAKPNGLICILDDQCNFPGATHETLLQKFNYIHKEHKFYEVPQRREPAFIICHYAGKVKYQVGEFREKNMDLMRHDIVSVLKNSSCAFVRELVGIDPVAVFRWAILRAFFRAYFAFRLPPARRTTPGEAKNPSCDKVNCSDPGQPHNTTVPDGRIVRKSRSFRSQLLGSRGGMPRKSLKSVKALAVHLTRIGVTNKHYNPRKQPISVSQQFQQSLHSLMVTLNQANPFFIRCIKSNAEKIPNMFDDAIVQRQLRYTGMLETVRIRQAGYNVRLSFDEFIHLYRILLPKGLKSEREDVEGLLKSLNLNPSNYQLGEHKVFLRESEKIKLDYFLHQEILKSIICIQRWYRTILERRQFLRLQRAAVTIQSYVRMFLAQRHLAYLRHNLRMMHLAATFIQKVWRAHRVRKWYENLRPSCIQFQARVRGLLVRRRVAHMRENLKAERENDAKPTQSIWNKGDGGKREDVYAALDSTGDSEGLEETLDGGRSTHPSHFPTNDSTLDYLNLTMNTTATAGPWIEPRPGSDFPSTGFNEIEQISTSVSVVAEEEVLVDPSESVIVDSLAAGRRDKTLAGTKTPSKNPFHRAKKHIKTIMISGGTVKTKAEKREAVLLESGSESEDLDPAAAAAALDSKLMAQLPAEPSCDTAPRRRRSGQQQQQQLHQTRSLQVGGGTVGEDLSWDRQRRGTARDPHLYPLGPSSDVAAGVLLPCSLIFTQHSQERLLVTSDTTTTTEVRRGSAGATTTATTTMTTRNGFEIGPHTFTERRRGSKEEEVVTTTTTTTATSSRRSSHKSAQKSPGAVASTQDDSNLSTSNNPLTFRRASPAVLDHSQNISGSQYSTQRNLRGQMSQPPSGDHHVGGASRTQGNKPSGSPAPEPLLFLGREIRRSRSVSETKGGSLPKDLLDTSITSRDLLGDASLLRATGPTHALDKVAKFHRGDSCALCKKNMHAVFSPGQRCRGCRLYFHDKCVQSGRISGRPCEAPLAAQEPLLVAVKSNRSKSETVARRLKRKPSKSQTDITKQKFSLTGTSEFTDAEDQIISDWRELQLMQEFITKKIYQVSKKDGAKSSVVDKIFEQALKEFKESLVSTFSIASKQGLMQLSITYKDLISYFANIMGTVCKQEGIGSDFATTMGVNALRGFLNEFMQTSRLEEKPAKVSAKSRKKVKRTNKRHKVEEALNYLGHSFVAMVVYIPTACEICTSFIMWPIERGIVCQKCKLACHKKCHPRLQIGCSEGITRPRDVHGAQIFGVPLRHLVPENGTVPFVVERLIAVIEFYGLRLEGLYRKSGVSSSVRELKNEMKEGREIDWEAYSPHVFTSVLKSFLRELPEPLLTFELYAEFLRAADLTLYEERVQTIFSILRKLPKPNYDLTERLVFHLVRVVLYEDKNRMNANSLAIIFAPCILRTNKPRQAQESLMDVSRETLCVETIISEQLKKVKATLSNIESVDSAALQVFVRLNSMRSSKLPTDKKYKGVAGPLNSVNTTAHRKLSHPSGAAAAGAGASAHAAMTFEEEEEYLQRHLEHLKNEKAFLTSALPSLSRTPSDDEMLSTDPEVESSAGSVDDLRGEMSNPYAPLPPQASVPQQRHQGDGGEAFEDMIPASPCKQCLPSGPSSLQGGADFSHPRVLKSKNRGPARKPPSRFVRHQFHPVNFGEDDAEEGFESERSDVDDDDDADADEEAPAIMV